MATSLRQLSEDITASQLDEIYQFAIELGKKAGQKLMDGVYTRIGGNISGISSGTGSDTNMTSNLVFEEKDNAVDIVTQVDEGKFRNFLAIPITVPTLYKAYVFPNNRKQVD